jgi:aminoglycoside phosphotransferase (APT) family kinase protein
MGFALVEGIAALGALDHESLGLGSFGRPAHFLERQVSRWRSQLESWIAYIPAADPTRRLRGTAAPPRGIALQQA